MSETAGVEVRYRALRAMGWSFSGQVGQQLVRLAVAVTLSRLLVPEDFGLVAIVATITGFAAVLTEAGVANALIHRRDLTDRHIWSAAWATLVLGLLLAGITVAISPWIASFFHEHELEALSIGFAADFLVSAPGLVPAALLARELRFGRVVTAELVGVSVGGSAAIVQAAVHPSPWPMVTFLVVSDLVSSILLVFAERYPVRLRPDWQALRELWEFSGGLLGYTVFNYWSRNADNLLIGRVLGSADLGIYSRCYTILLFPVQQVAQIVNRVMFPAMAGIRDDRPRIRFAYIRTNAVVALVIFPASALLVVAAHPLVIGVLGAQWSAAIPVLRVFAVIAAIQSIGTTTGWLYQVTGETTRMFHVTIWLTALVIGAFVIGVQWGLMGVVYSYLAWNAISLPVNVIYSGRPVSLRLRALGRAVVAPLVMAIVLGALLVAVAVALPTMPDVAQLVCLTVAAAVIYGIEVAAVRPMAWRELRSAAADLRRGAPETGVAE